MALNTVRASGPREGRAHPLGSRELSPEPGPASVRGRFGVAYVVCAALGLDISGFGVDYLADWFRGDTDVLEQALTAIHRAAASGLADLDTDEDQGDG
jgi:hypothetical protein